MLRVALCPAHGDLVHGEEKARLALGDERQKRYGVVVHRPKLEEAIALV
jgi:hypothetical protein